MKRFAVAVCVVFVVGLVVGVTSLIAGEHKHDVAAEVVSVDMEGMKLTFKNADGEEMTAPVMEEAAKSLEGLKAGDMVTLTCTDTEEGEHQGISAIKKAMKEKKE